MSKVVWRRLQIGERIYFGDWFSTRTYDPNLTAEDLKLWMTRNPEKDAVLRPIYSSVGMIINELTLLEVWRPTFEDEATSEPTMEERKIEPDL